MQWFFCHKTSLYNDPMPKTVTDTGDPLCFYTETFTEHQIKHSHIHLDISTKRITLVACKQAKPCKKIYR